MPTLKQADGIPQVTTVPRRGKEVIYATHNFCDPQSWYSESVRVTGQVLTETTGIVYALPHSPIVNLREGKVFDEEGLYQDQAEAEPGDPHAYQTKVYVDGVEASQRDPFADSGGDYHVDYQNGTVVFASSQAGSTITADYSYTSGSGWIMKPTSGRYLLIDDAEVQFTDDINYNTTLVMEIYGNADYFDPQLGLPSGTPIPIGSTLYKTVQQIIDEAVGVKPHVPAFLQSDPRRAPQNPVYTFPFRYTVARPLFSSLGMYARIRLEGDTPFGGGRATATFYMMSRGDPGPLRALTELSAT